MESTTLEMSWKQILIAPRRKNRGLLASSSGPGDPVPRGFLFGNLSGFHQHFCGSGLRIIWSGTRNVPWHASWEQGYHGLIIPIIQQIQNREHFNLGPETFVSLSLLSLAILIHYSLRRGGRRSRQSCGLVSVRFAYFLFSRSVCFAIRHPQSAPPPLPRPPPPSHQCQCFVDIAGDIYPQCRDTHTGSWERDGENDMVIGLDASSWPALTRRLSYGQNGQFYDPGCQ